MRIWTMAALAVASSALTGACSSDTDTASAVSTTGVVTQAADGPSEADVPAGSVRVSGAVENPTTLSGDQLRAYPAQRQSVTFESGSGSQAHTYDGAALSDILTSAALAGDIDAKNPDLTFAILATGTDGYQATVSFGELSPDFGRVVVLVAYTEDGQPLEKPRLIVPGDQKGGRYVSGLTDLTIVDLRSN